MKKRLTALVLSLTLLFLCGCAGPAVSEGPDEDPAQQGGWRYTFVDSTGREVVLTKRPERVAVLFSSYAEIWNLAGGSVAVTVGESVERGFVSEETPLVDGGAGKTIDYELLLAARPDFVIGSADIEAQVDACRMLAEAGIPAAVFRVDTFEEYLTMLKRCTDITGNENAYAEHGTAVAERVDKVKAAACLAEEEEEKEILFIRAGSQASATKAKRAPDNFVCIMLAELGAENIADDAAVLLDGLSLEEILIRDPDYIFLTTMGSEAAAKAYVGDLFAQDGWKDLAAVREGNYVFLEKDLFHFKPNARWDEAYEILARLLYPELTIHE